MDLAQVTIARSDQLNSSDLIGGPQTFTVLEVRPGSEEQPVQIVLAELPKGRTFKPSKTVMRILEYAWGRYTEDWPTNPRMTLFRDEKVKWAGQAIGGIRVSHLSHIEKQIKIALQESKGKSVLHTIDPLPDAPAAPNPVELTPLELAAQVAAGLADSTTEAEVREWGNRANARGLLDLSPKGIPGTLREMVQTRLAELTGADQ